MRVNVSWGIRTTVVAMGALGVLAAAPVQAQNLITNGGFELQAFASQFRGLPAGNTTLTGWTIGGGGVDHIRTYWQPDEGAQSLDLSRQTAGSISQTIATLSGGTYGISFAMAGNPQAPQGIKSMLVSFGTVGSQVFNFNTTGNSRPSMGWITMGTSFIANANFTTITFSSLTNTAFGPALDDVQVTLTAPPAAPEPGTVALAGLGLLPLGLVLRRRK